MCPLGGSWIDGGAEPVWASGRMICHVLLIETDAHGLLLVDAGVGLADIADPMHRLGGVFTKVLSPVLDENETAVRRVEKLGFSPADVRNVVLTHMDLDHAGGLSDFPEATVHVTREEKHAAFAPPARLTRERLRYRPVQWAHRPRFETYEPEGEPWFGFAAVRQLRCLPPEVLLVPLIGHSRGHSAVAVQSGGRWLLHCGDAYFHEDEVDPDHPGCPPFLTFFQNVVAADRGRMRHNKRRLRELVRSHADEVDVFCAHDETELLRLQGRAPRAMGE